MKRQTDPLTDFFLDCLWDLTGIDLAYWIGQVIVYGLIVAAAIYFFTKLTMI